MAPIVTGISPNQGAPEGNTGVTITGSGFTGATLVRFGSTPTNFVLVSDTQITARTPPGSGTVMVTVTAPTGTSTQNVLFTYTTVAAPVLTTLSPASGPTSGGTVVTLSGINLAGVLSVKFGVNSATMLSNTASQVVVVAPAGVLSSVAVTVTTVGGTSNALVYTYVAAAVPVISGLSPSSGPVSGGNLVTVTGSNLSGVLSVKFGVNSATVLSNTASQVVVVAPAGSPSSVAVTVTTVGGTSNALVYTYVAAAVPVISGLSPSSGPVSGGNLVTVTGSNLSGVLSVKFGVNSATVLSNTASQVVVVAPAGSPSSVAVTVTTVGGTSNALVYTYVAAAVPVISGLSPSSGPVQGGNLVTVTGSNLSGAISVKFGNNPATVLSNTATQVVVTAPAGPPSATTVTVTTAGGTSNPLPYFYVAAPTVNDLSAHFGPATGGNTVAVFGSNLTLASAVSFGGNPATAVLVISDSQLTATAPAGAGTVVVTVTTPGGTSTAATGNPYYTYLAAPVLSSLTPSHGPDLGGDAIVLGGSNLTYTDAVTFGGVSASFAAVSDTQVVATSPGGAPGTVNVVAHTPAGDSNVLPYVYDPS
ncbi:cell shape-determining protein [Streptomyces sp. TM32]|uniref:IPT/TIG domain-containing protein n=1 Tax=Streptomyces sp. TM32 TaxID=1652669 RepID=UPI0010102149|nr:IPT/TIG domain-containing protein [Streptomyces sp. TM32]RXS70753.1 cell shape-determining protein [Streptomyces sp. TM32]